MTSLPSAQDSLPGTQLSLPGITQPAEVSASPPRDSVATTTVDASLLQLQQTHQVEHPGQYKRPSRRSPLSDALYVQFLCLSKKKPAKIFATSAVVVDAPIGGADLKSRCSVRGCAGSSCGFGTSLF